MFRLSKIIFFLLFSLIIKVWATEVPKDVILVGAQSINIEGKTYLAVNYKNKEGWHTYWKNPGDAGLTLQFKFLDNKKEVKLSELEWPVPKKLKELASGNVAFAYVGTYTIFFDLGKLLNSKNFVIDTNWLICHDICVPGKINLEGSIQGGKVVIKNNQVTRRDDELLLEYKKLPKITECPPDLKLKLVKHESALALTYHWVGTKRDDQDVLTPMLQAPFAFGHEEVKSNGDYLLPVGWDGEYLDPPVKLPENGKFKSPYQLKFLFVHPKTGEAQIIQQTFSGFETAQKKNEEIKTATSSAPQDGSLIYFLLMAFIGGVILNLMPCVLPVISLKLFEVIKHKEKSRLTIIRHNLSYTFGVISTLLILGIIVIVFKNSGENIGWGFQLQSPIFVASMIIFLFIFALNLFGLFEFMTPGGKFLGNIRTNEGIFGDYLNGVLATILSTPCSAPFLGTALTFAFASSNLVILLILFFVGLGLASPFLLTAMFPSLVHFLPRPGHWMNTFKKFLGLTIILTNLWLLDIYMNLVSESFEVIKLLAVLTTIFFIFFSLRSISKAPAYVMALVVIVFGLTGKLYIDLGHTANNQSDVKILDEIKWGKWSSEAMKKYASENRYVFINFTAKWCLTCKVNKKLVLDSDEFKAISKEKNFALLEGDWTKNDELIGKFLHDNGLVGVPAYFIQKPNGELVNLKETISIEKIKNNL